MSKIDIKEDELLKKELLDILLQDKTTSQNILWATDSYEFMEATYFSNMQMTINAITGKHSKLIQPRVLKSKKEQLSRTKDKGEVFTPLSIVEQMNDACDSIKVTEYNWQEYVALLKLEITCGEAPFIVSRYNPVADRKELLKISNRVGFLDKKLKIVSKYCDNEVVWLKWAKIAFQSSYGYEWQGDSLLIARENLLYTFIDYYQDKFNNLPSINTQKEIAEIIVWNIFQMDGIKCVIPMSCKSEKIIIKGYETLFGKDDDQVKEIPCEGCEKKLLNMHNGVYAKTMNWRSGTSIRFIDIMAG